MDDVLDLPPPQYLGKRRQSTLEEIAAFKEKISFKKEQDVEEDGKDEEEVSLDFYPLLIYRSETMKFCVSSYLWINRFTCHNQVR